MKDDVTRKIETLINRNEPLTESEVSHLMTLCRKAVDHLPEAESASYPIVRFFCNWAMHITLDRSLEGMGILKRINDSLVELAKSHTDLITRRVTEIVSFRQLRRETKALFSSLEIGAGLADEQPKWENFTRHLIEIIRDCPVEVGEVDSMSRRAKELYETIVANPLKPGGWVVGLSVAEVDYGLLQGSDPRKLLCIHVLMSDTTHIVIPMDSREVFGHPVQ